EFYRVQAGVFNQLSNAEAQVALLREAGFEAFISPGPPYRVQTGAFSTLENAERYAAQLREKGFDAAVIRP
ncbi:MAG: SPOR domain-containing protein, partial [Firmicutes bacterium]|nr:SPOR domain-containing protein [Bacillota bacterium]